MPWIDIGLLVLIVGFTLVGFWLGFVQMMGNLLGTFLGITVAGRLVDPVMTWMHSDSGWTRVIVFIVAYSIVSRVFDVVFWFVRKTFGVISWLPLAGLANRMVGAVLGLAEGIIAIGAALFVASAFVPEPTLQAWLATSSVAWALLAIMQLFKFLLPEAIRLLNR